MLREGSLFARYTHLTCASFARFPLCGPPHPRGTGLGGDKGDAGAGALALAADEVAAKLGARSGAGVRAAGTVGGSPGRRGDRSGGGSGGYGSCGGGGRGHVHFTYGKPGEVDEAAIGERMLPEPQEGNVECKCPPIMQVVYALLL